MGSSVGVLVCDGGGVALEAVENEGGAEDERCNDAGQSLGAGGEQRGEEGA